jgi:hypothetical protein
LKNSLTFCQHSGLVCFVLISGQTATVFLYRINRLVFISVAVRVYCAVRTETLNIFQFNLTLSGVQKLSTSPLQSPSYALYITKYSVIVSVYSINQFSFVSDRHFVYSEVGNKSYYLDIFYAFMCMKTSFSFPPLPFAVWVRSYAFRAPITSNIHHCKLLGKWSTGLCEILFWEVCLSF